MTRDELIRRANRLTSYERHILEQSPYDACGTNWGSLLRARWLANEGLLERNPTSRNCYRITSDGESVLKIHKKLVEFYRSNGIPRD